MTILEITNLKKYYDVQNNFGPITQVKALDGVSFKLEKNKTLGIVGESGCGKSTLAKTLMRIEKITDGSAKINEKDIESFSKGEFQSKIQMVFQDPYSSINPRKKAWQIITAPLLINTNKSKKECFEIACTLMQKVGLRAEFANRYPHQFSGGQRQRIGLARALTMNPEILILDEPVSALDVSVQAQVLNLLNDLQKEFNLTYIFISHDLSVVRHICDDVMVMYFGKIVEYGPRDQIFDNPKHPYTQGLLASSPIIGKEVEESLIDGELPSPFDPPKGCSFHSRCPKAQDSCLKSTPELENKFNRMAACFEI